MSTVTQGVRRAYVDTQLGQMHYRVAGPPGGAGLVCLHQSPSSGAMWEPVLPRFAALGYRALAPDLLGHGASDPGCEAPALADYARGVWAVLDALDIPRCDVIGHHSGASVALLMATQQPARIRALALWGVPLLTPEHQARLAIEQAPDWANAPEWLGMRWQRRRASSEPGWTPEIGRRAMLELMQAGPDTQWLYHAVASTSVEPLLLRVRQPVLTIASELDVLCEASERAARLLPNARFANLHGTTLDIADQQPDLLVEVIDTFLTEAGADPR